MLPDLLTGVAVWVSVAAAVSLGGSIFCGTLWAGIGPGFVIVVIVVGIIKVDMVSIFATWDLSRRGESWRTQFCHVTERNPRGTTTKTLVDAILSIFLLNLINCDEYGLWGEDNQRRVRFMRNINGPWICRGITVIEGSKERLRLCD